MDLPKLIVFIFEELNLNAGSALFQHTRDIRMRKFTNTHTGITDNRILNFTKFSINSYDNNHKIKTVR